MIFQICGVTVHPSEENQNYMLHSVKTNLRETKGLSVKRKAKRVQENGRIILSFWRKQLSEHEPKSTHHKGKDPQRQPQKSLQPVGRTHHKPKSHKPPNGEMQTLD